MHEQIRKYYIIIYKYARHMQYYIIIYKYARHMQYYINEMKCNIIYLGIPFRYIII